MKVLIGAAGGAHLAGVLAAKTACRYWPVPMPSKHCTGLDSCWPWCRCRAAFRWQRLPSARPERSTRRFSRSPCWPCDAELAKKLAEVPYQSDRESAGENTSRSALN